MGHARSATDGRTEARPGSRVSPWWRRVACGLCTVCIADASRPILSDDGYRSEKSRRRPRVSNTRFDDIPMTLAATKPHPIFLAGRWVDSPEVLEVTNPAR